MAKNNEPKTEIFRTFVVTLSLRRLAYLILPFVFVYLKKFREILRKLPDVHAILFYFKRDTIVPNFVKSFRYIKGNTSYLNRNQKICKF